VREFVGTSFPELTSGLIAHAMLGISAPFFYQEQVREANVRFGAVVRWLKGNPFVVLLGIIGTVAGAIAGVPKAWHAISLALDIPECGTYSNAYYYYNGYFRKDASAPACLRGDGPVDI
jgi:hypothetical protein